MTTTPNPSLSGQGITFHPTMTSSSSVGGPTSGTINITSTCGIAYSTSWDGVQMSLGSSQTVLNSCNFTATYSGNTYYLPSSYSWRQIIVAGASAISVQITPNGPVTYGTSLVFNIKVLDINATGHTPTGSVTFTLNGTTTQLGTTTLDASAQGTVTISSLPASPGAVVEVDYSGDTYFSAASNFTSPIVVNPATTQVTSLTSPATLYYGETLPFTINVTSLVASPPTQPSGMVRFSNVGSAFPDQMVSLDSLGRASWNFSLQVGVNNLTISFLGNANFSISSISQLQVVNKGSIQFDVIPQPFAYGQNASWSADISPTPPTPSSLRPTGFLNFVSSLASSPPLPIPLLGPVDWNFGSVLPAGSNSYYVNYSGDSNFLGGVSPNYTQVINPANTSLTILPILTSVIYSALNTITIQVSTLTPSSINVSKGNVALNDGIQLLTGSVNLTGYAQISIAFSKSGVWTVTATYSDDTGFFLGSTATADITVGKADTMVTLINPPSGSTYGDTLQLLAYVAPLDLQFLVSGQVVYTFGSISLGTSTLNSSGYAELSTNELSAGSGEVVMVSYQGDINLNGNSTNFTIDVSRAVPTLSFTPAPPPTSSPGENVSFAASFSGVGPALPTGTVDVLFNNSFLTSVPITSGSVAFTSATLPTTSQPVLFSFTYGGDANYQNTTVSAAHQVIANSACTPTICQNSGTCYPQSQDPFYSCGCLPCWSDFNCSTSTIPSFTITLSSTQIYFPSPLFLSPILNFPPCLTNLNVTASFQWTQPVGTPPLSAQASSSRDLYVAGSTLSISSHQFQFAVTLTVGGNSKTQTQSVLVDVLHSPLVAIITGSQQFSTFSNFTLDASGSYDPDAPTSTILTYSWVCNGVNVTCPLISQPQAKVLTFLANSFSAGVYNFTLQVNSTDGRSSSSAITVNAIASPVPSVSISIPPPATSTINPQDILRLVGTIAYSGNESIAQSWSEKSGLNIYNPTFLGGAINASNLILLPGLLQPGQSYTFLFTVVTSISKFTSVASVVINVNSVAIGGTCSISPSSGISVLDTFTANSSGWSISDMSTLSYSYSYFTSNNATQLTTLTNINSASTASFFLPQGSVTIVVTIYTSKGALTISNCTPVVVVSPLPNASDCSIQAYSQTLLAQAQALQNANSILQLVDLFMGIMLNSSLTPGTTCSNQSLAQATQLRNNLWITFLNAINQTTQQPMNSVFASQVAEVLVFLTEVLFDQSVYAAQTNATQLEILDVTLSILQAVVLTVSSRQQLNEGVLLILSQLLDTVPCEFLPRVLDLINLLTANTVQGSVPNENFVNFVAPALQGSGLTLSTNQGTQNVTVNGLQLTLPPELLAQGQNISSNDPRFINNAFIDVTITRYDLRRCRGNDTLATYTIDLSSLGQIISVSGLVQPFEFYIPIDFNVSFSLNDCGTATLPFCAYWDYQNNLWNQSGCITEGVVVINQTSGAKAVKCACNHLTDFSVLVKQVQKGSCATRDTVAYQIFALIYLVVFSLSLIQIIRVSRILLGVALGSRKSSAKGGTATIGGGSCQLNPLLGQHASICFVSLCRALASASLGSIFNLPNGGLAAVVAFPYVAMFWVFTSMVFQWANVIHFSMGNKEDSPLAKLVKGLFIVCNILIAGLILTFFIALVLNYHLTAIGMIASISVSIIYAFTGVAFIIYGSLLARTLAGVPMHGKKNALLARLCEGTCTLAVRIQTTAILISLCFIVESIIWAISVQDDRDIFDRLFYCIDIIALLAVLFVFYASVQRFVTADQSMKHTTLGSRQSSRPNKHTSSKNSSAIQLDGVSPQDEITEDEGLPKSASYAVSATSPDEVVASSMEDTLVPDTEEDPHHAEVVASLEEKVDDAFLSSVFPDIIAPTPPLPVTPSPPSPDLSPLPAAVGDDGGYTPSLTSLTPLPPRSLSPSPPSSPSPPIPPSAPMPPPPRPPQPPQPPQYFQYPPQPPPQPPQPPGDSYNGF